MRTDREAVTIGVSSCLVIALVTAAALAYEDLPLVAGGTTYQAELSEAAGLRASDPVRIAGTTVGSVTAVELAGDRVLATFRVDEWVGDRSTASVRIQTLLGAKYLSLDPRGAQAQDPQSPIPLERTTSPFDITTAFDALSGTLEEVDTGLLAESLRTVADTFRAAPEETRAALDGLSRLSQTIASRDDELATLLAQTRQASGVLADRNAEFERLVSDGALLLAEVQRRRDAISALLTGTRALAAELRGLIAENTAQLRPALDQLDRVTAVLQRNQSELDRTLELMPTFFRTAGNALGTGRWLDGFADNLIPPSADSIFRVPRPAGG